MKNQLTERILWFRSFYPIMFAHKPLCARFQKDSIQIRNVYVCRSCSMLYLGILVFGCFNFKFNLFIKDYLSYIFGYFFLIIVLSFPFLFNKFHRITRDMLRFSLGGVFALIPWLLWHQYYWIGSIFVSILFFIKRVYSLFRKTLQSSECKQCDEFYQDKICSGFSLKAQQMKKYERGIEKIIF